MSTTRLLVINLVMPLIFVFGGVLTFAPTHAMDACEQLFVESSVRRESLTPDDFSEDILLRAFSPEATLAGHVKLLSETGVVLIRQSTGAEYVLRLPTGERNDPDFETFANAFIRLAPGVHSPEVRKLSIEETDRLRQDLKAKEPEFYHSLIEDFRANGSPLQNRPWTVTLFHRAIKGDSALAALHVWSSMRELLSEIAANTHLGTREIEYARKRLHRAWSALSPNEKTQVIADVRRLIPALKFTPEEEILSALETHLQKLPKTSLNQLLSWGLTRIPVHIRQQLADGWALYAALGIPDFHPGNWLIRDGDVLLIDQAWKTKWFSEGTPDISQFKSHPFGHYDTNSAVRYYLQSSISVEMQRYLRSLKPQRIRAIAKRSGFTITDREVEGVIARIRFILGDG